jgi:hypothetical protein
MPNPTPLELAFAISDSLPAELSYSGSETYRVTARTDLSPIDGAGEGPFAFAVTIDGAEGSYTVVVARTEGLSAVENGKRSVSFEV